MRALPSIYVKCWWECVGERKNNCWQRHRRAVGWSVGQPRVLRARDKRRTENAVCVIKKAPRPRSVAVTKEKINVRTRRLWNGLSREWVCVRVPAWVAHCDKDAKASGAHDFTFVYVCKLLACDGPWENAVVFLSLNSASWPPPTLAICPQR